MTTRAAILQAFGEQLREPGRDSLSSTEAARTVGVSVRHYGCDVLAFTGRGSQASTMFTAVEREIPPGPPEVPKLLVVLQDNGLTVHL